jgi:hypothetical protein
MITALGWLLTAAALVFVGWPLVRSAAGGEAAEPESLSPLERQKLEAYAAIKEAEFDRRMGKLSDEDYAAITHRYRQQALAAIAALERVRADAAPRRGRTVVRMAFCPSCGGRLPNQANFCSHCGRALRDSAA